MSDKSNAFKLINNNHSVSINITREPYYLATHRAKTKSKYVNQTTTCDFIFDRISNVCSICHHFRYIHSRNVHDLDL